MKGFVAFILLVIVYFCVPEDTGVTPQDDEGVFSEVLVCEGLHDLCLRGAQHVHRLQPQSVRVKETNVLSSFSVQYTRSSSALQWSSKLAGIVDWQPISLLIWI